MTPPRRPDEAIHLECPCGQTLRAAPEHLGRRVRCRCGREHTVRRPRPTFRAFTERLQHFVVEWGRRLGSAGRRLAGVSAQPPVSTTPRRRWLALWTGRLAIGYLLLVVLVAAGLWLLADRWWPATILLFGPRWLLLVPAAVLAPAALAWHRRALGVVMLAIGVVVVPIMGLHLSWRPWRDTTRQPGDVRVVSFNVAGQPALALAVVLYDWEADVVAVQECQADAIPERLLTLPGWYHHLSGPMCLFTRYPILRQDSLPRWQAGALGTSGYAWSYRLAPPGGQPFTFVNLHLETPRKGLEPLQRTASPAALMGNTEVREIGSRRIRRWVDSLAPPLIVAGDFNMPVESRIYQAYWGDLGNAFSDAGNGLGGTRDMVRFRVRIDHVLYDSGWRAISATPGRALGSDHLPMVADLRPRHR